MMKDFCRYCCYTIDDNEHEDYLESLVDDMEIPLKANIKLGVIDNRGNLTSDVISGNGEICFEAETRLTATIFDKGNLWITVDEERWDNPVFETIKDSEYEHDEAIARKIMKINFCPMCGRDLRNDP